MRRREFIRLLGGAAVAWPVAARAQSGERVRRVGVLGGFRDIERTAWSRPSVRPCGGWLDGGAQPADRHRSGEGDGARIRALATELAGASPEVCWPCRRLALVALRELTRTIPISSSTCPIRSTEGSSQHGASGRQRTGFTSFEYSLGSKWLEALKESSPGLARVMVMLNEQNYHFAWAVMRAIESGGALARHPYERGRHPQCRGHRARLQRFRARARWRPDRLP